MKAAMTKADRPDLAVNPRSFVYFARGNKSRLIKIGVSVNPTQRVRGFSNEFGESVTILFTVPGDYTAEAGFHRRFKRYTARGREWFHEAGELHKFLKKRGYASAETFMEDVDQRKPARTVGGPEPIPALPEGWSWDSKKKSGPYPIAALAQLAVRQGFGGNPNPALIGYARVSTEEQSLDMQTAALKQAGVTTVFAEKIGAQNAKRPQFHLMRKHLRPGDTLVVYAYNRLSRDLKTLLTVVDELKAKGISVKSTSEPHINPHTTNGRLLISVTGAVDENERGRIRDRTRDGMAERMAQGVVMGRPRVVTVAVAKEMKAMHKRGIPAPVIKKKFKCSLSAVYANWN